MQACRIQPKAQTLTAGAHYVNPRKVHGMSLLEYNDPGGNRVFMILWVQEETAILASFGGKHRNGSTGF